jgi:hypothetical protein
LAWLPGRLQTDEFSLSPYPAFDARERAMVSITVVISLKLPESRTMLQWDWVSSFSVSFKESL